MKKEEILKEKLQIVDWANTLRAISDELWFKPFRDGSWGTADVVSHFISWDQFLIENRILYLLNHEAFPKLSVDIEEINNAASAYARSGITKDQLINEFISIRHRLVSLLDELGSEKYKMPYPGNNNITLSEYLACMIEHDRKHIDQIEAFIS